VRNLIFGTDSQVVKHMKVRSIWMIEDFEGVKTLKSCQNHKTLTSFVVIWRIVTIKLWVVQFVFYWSRAKANKGIQGQWNKTYNSNWSKGMSNELQSPLTKSRNILTSLNSSFSRTPFMHWHSSTSLKTLPI